MKNKIIVDAIYINSFGGKEILLSFIENLIDKNRFIFLIDKRLEDPILEKIDYFKLQPTELARCKFYWKKKFKKIICLGNVPPPLWTNCKNISIYFHNALLIDKRNLKFAYISLLNRSKYKWIVQTMYMKGLLENKINNEINILPIVSLKRPKSFLEKTEGTYIYPSSNLSHKNIERLIKAFFQTTSKSKKTLYLTIAGENIEKENVSIIFLGILNKEKLDNYYKKCEYLIFPSLVESFGIPLVESVFYNCKILCADLPYINGIVKPSLTFDPNDTKDISRIIDFSLNHKLPESKLLIKVDKQVFYDTFEKIN